VAELVRRARLKIGWPSGRAGSSPAPGIAWSGQGLAHNTVRLLIAPVKALLATAHEEGLIRASPAENHSPNLGAAADANKARWIDDRGVKERTDIMFETIVWATDGSELANNALDDVRQLAEIHGSRIVAVHANEVFTGRAAGAPMIADEPEIREEIESQVEVLRLAGFDARLKVISGTDDVAVLVARAADEVEADLIVVGTHGRGRLTATLLGSVARSLCRTSHRPVLVIPPDAAAERSNGEVVRSTTTA
jgi:nucleotide-binding universal stress UspA family protein